VKIRHSIHGLLMLDTPTKQWCAWCPELDVMTQGDHPDNAAAMLEEACRMVLEDAVNYIHESWIEPDLAINFRKKRVVHPLRLGAKASEDESWPLYQYLLNAERRVDGYKRIDSFSLNELTDGLDANILVGGSMQVESRAGVNKVMVWFDDFGDVPVEEYHVEYMQAFPRSTSVSVRSSVIRSGAEPLSVVSEYVEYLKRDSVGEMRITKK
jgi:predicted RNase H-like HicB family nuclease